MGTADVIEKILNLPLLSYKGLVDLVDKMSFIASCLLLIACSLIVTLREYIMEPISCYMSHSPGGENLLKYIENYCWVQGTMTIDDHIVPDNTADWEKFEKSRIVYYQWAPFVLLIQSALFFLPITLWVTICINIAGTDVTKLVQEAGSKEPKEVASVLENLFIQHREYRHGLMHNVKSTLYRFLKCCLISKRFGTRLSCGYIFMKIVYLANSIGQIYLMQAFLHLNTHKEYSSNFGMEIFRNIVNGRNWEVTNIFPRVTYCMARIKHMANMNVVTAQCVLTANLFIEKIYIFLWFWIILVAIFTTISLLTWIIVLICPSRSYSEIMKLLRLRGHDIEKPDQVKKFCNHFLRLDGIFLIRMISVNVGDLVSGAIVSELYQSYSTKYKNVNLFKESQLLICNPNDIHKVIDNNQNSVPILPP